MRFIEYITEKRSHDIPKLSVVDALKKYKNDPDIYISYTDVEKLGINPTFGYNTPLGIYFYPLKEVWENVVDNSIPFAGDRKWVWAIRATGLLNLDKYNYARLTEDIIKLTAVFKPKGTEKDFDRAYEDAKRDSRNNPGRLIFYFTHNLATWANNTVVEWSRILRKILGYKGVRDTKGIIHINEPIQAIVFTARDYEIVEKIANIRPSTLKRVVMKTLREFFASNLVSPDYYKSMIASRQTEYTIAAGRVLVMVSPKAWTNMSVDDFKFIAELVEKHNIPIRTLTDIIHNLGYRPDIIKTAVDSGKIDLLDTMTKAVKILTGRSTLNRIEEYFNKDIGDYQSYGGYLLYVKNVIETTDINSFKLLLDDLVLNYYDMTIITRLILAMKQDQKEALGYFIGTKWDKSIVGKRPSVDELIEGYKSYILNDYKSIREIVKFIDKKYVEKYYEG